jgi:CRP/FNR family transcriptional regulator, cyclic AMP receptor protein
VLEHRIERGTVLVAAGDPDNRLLVVRDGLLGLQMEKKGATRPHLVELVGRDGTFGETALLGSHEPWPLAVIALAPSHVTELRMEELSDGARTSLLPLAVKLVARRVREREDKVAYMRSVSAPQRVAGCLCDLVSLAGQARGQRLSTLERCVLTQEHMAQYIGCARDKVNRALGTFARAGWIELSARHINVIDLPALHSFSGCETIPSRQQGAGPSGPQLVEELLRVVRSRLEPGDRFPSLGAA